MSGETESVVDGGESGRCGGGGELAGDDQPQTYIRGPNIYKYHVRIGATRTSHERRDRVCLEAPVLRLVYHVPALYPVGSHLASSTGSSLVAPQELHSNNEDLLNAWELRSWNRPSCGS
jgi:hypothetical protein